ncbi:hypothetical protein NLJ89_g9782 [Agrocybe chaxingu]|uniref:Uncharacterized protein n=1 Tax=Agrocybe chaxingu TaxID=84603 RepID=A0A9W8JSU5_9AGAR|nr:hypothetical protein NLJ89_g9782 [Agrocybe chaxingu]
MPLTGKLPTKVPIAINPKSHFIFAPTSQWYAALPFLPPQNTALASATPILPNLPPYPQRLHPSRHAHLPLLLLLLRFCRGVLPL